MVNYVVMIRIVFSTLTLENLLFVFLNLGDAAYHLYQHKVKLEQHT